MNKDLDIDYEALANRDEVNAKIDGEVEDPKPAAKTSEAKSEETVTKTEEDATKTADESKVNEGEGDANADADAGETADILMQFKSTIESDLGVEITAEDLEGIDLTPGLDTASKLAVVGAKKLAAQIRAEEFASNPAYEKAWNHIKANGSLEGIEAKFEIPDYSKVDLEDVNMQKAMFKASLQMKGIEDADIDDMITLAEDKGILKDKAEAAKKSVVEHFQGELDARVAADKEAVKVRQAEYNQTISEISEFVGKGQILGVTLTKADQKGFLEFITKPVDKSGKTARDIYDEKMSLENDMYLELLKYKDFKNVTPKTDKKVATLKELMEAGKGRTNEVGSGKVDSNFTPGNQEIDMDALNTYINGRKSK